MHGTADEMNLLAKRLPFVLYDFLDGASFENVKFVGVATLLHKTLIGVPFHSLPIHLFEIHAYIWKQIHCVFNLV